MRHWASRRVTVMWWEPRMSCHGVTRSSEQPPRTCCSAGMDEMRETARVGHRRPRGRIAAGPVPERSVGCSGHCTHGRARRQDTADFFRIFGEVKSAAEWMAQSASYWHACFILQRTRPRRYRRIVCRQSGMAAEHSEHMNGVDGEMRDRKMTEYLARAWR